VQLAGFIVHAKQERAEALSASLRGRESADDEFLPLFAFELDPAGRPGGDIGCVDALANQALQAHLGVIVEAANYGREAGREACRALVGQFPALTAIAAGNDLVALGCYDHFREAGIACPGRISVVGHNDMPFVDALTPPLTTIRIAVHEMGAKAATLLLARIDGAGTEPASVVLCPELIVRGSTAPPAD
jgi:LacI family transcriptional regulator